MNWKLKTNESKEEETINLVKVDYKFLQSDCIAYISCFFQVTQDLFQINNFGGGSR